MQYSRHLIRIPRGVRPVFAVALSLLLAYTAPVSAQPNTPMEKLKAMAEDTAATPDLAEAALLASKLIQPEVDPAVYGRKLDGLASELRSTIGSETRPLEIAAIMARFLYGEKEFANSTVQSAEVFVGLDQVLDRKQWNCVGMALLYATLGSRLDLPLQPVAGHGHVLVAWSGDPYFFIETTAQGGLQPTRDYLIEYLPYPCVNPAAYELLDGRGAIAMCLTQMALVMQKDDRVQLAGSLFDLAIQFSDTYAEAYAGRGFLRAAAKKHSEAVADFERAIELDPDLREAYGGLGTSYRALGNMGSAVGTYRTLVSLCPEDSKAVFNAGQLLYETGDLEGAVQAFRHYIDLEPRDPEGYVRLAYPLEDGGDLAGAAEAYRRALQLAPNYPDAILNLAYILEQMQNLEAAMEGYRRTLALQPGNVQAAGGVARVLGKANRYDDALAAFRQALKQYPGVAFLWADLGQLLENRGNLKQAIGAYQEAVRVDPSDPEAYYALARTLRAAGLQADAQQVIARAREVEAAQAQRATAGPQPAPLPDTPVGESGVEDLFPADPEETASAPGAEEEMEAPEPGATPGTNEDDTGESPTADTPETPNATPQPPSTDPAPETPETTPPQEPEIPELDRAPASSEATTE